MTTPPKAKPPDRPKRDCPICGKSYVRLPNHLTDVHRLKRKEERAPYLRIAKERTPDQRLLSKS